MAYPAVRIAVFSDDTPILGTRAYSHIKIADAVFCPICESIYHEKVLHCPGCSSSRRISLIHYVQNFHIDDVASGPSKVMMDGSAELARRR